MQAPVDKSTRTAEVSPSGAGGSGLGSSTPSPAPLPRSQYVNGGDDNVIFDAADENAKELLNAGVTCGPIEITLQDFLLMRAIQGRSFMRQQYLATSATDSTPSSIILVETDEKLDGTPVIPDQKSIVYTYKWAGSIPVLGGETPDVGMTDPITFMSSNHSAICNSAYVFGLFGGPGATRPLTPEAILARLRHLLAEPPARPSVEPVQPAVTSSPKIEDPPAPDVSQPVEDQNMGSDDDPPPHVAV